MSNETGKSPARVTLAEVARAAGLSPTTISLALNRRPEECHLSEATRQRAIEAATRLGYRPNWRARALAKRQTFTVGLVHACLTPLMTAINEQLVAALAQRLAEGGYHALLVSLPDESPQWQDVIRSDRLDGCLILHPMPAQTSQILTEAQLPMVTANVLSELPVPQVLADDRGGMRQLMAHLLALGHRRIAFLSRGQRAYDHYSAQHRRDEYERVMREASLPPCIRSATVFLDEFSAGPPQPTAVLCEHHPLAIELLEACWRRGVVVPGQLSVATFNDVYPTGHVIPPLTTVRLPSGEIGRRSAALLIDLIERRQQVVTDRSAEPPREWLPEELVIRESTARPRA